MIEPADVLSPRSEAAKFIIFAVFALAVYPGLIRNYALLQR